MKQKLMNEGYRRFSHDVPLYVKQTTKDRNWIRWLVEVLAKFLENTFYGLDCVFKLDVKTMGSPVWLWFRPVYFNFAIFNKGILEYSSDWLKLNIRNIFRVIQDIWDLISKGLTARMLTDTVKEIAKPVKK